jgi:hypothetical protein
MSTRTRDWKADVDVIRKILTSDWNPIGCGVPDDEYDGYIPAIYRMVHSRAEVEELASHLSEIVTENMGLDADAAKDRRVAKMLLELMD